MEMKRSPEQVKDQIHRLLQEHNAGYMGGFRDYSFHIEENGEVLGGIVAESVGDTLEVAYLYVKEPYRGTGLGSLLLRQVEAEAAKDGIRRVFLNTYSFQAPALYRKLGYRQLFELAPCFGPHSQFYFVKDLA